MCGACVCKVFVCGACVCDAFVSGVCVYILCVVSSGCE